MFFRIVTKLKGKEQSKSKMLTLYVKIKRKNFIILENRIKIDSNGTHTSLYTQCKLKLQLPVIQLVE